MAPGIAHPSLSRESCLGCHAPIAAEWRESFHFQSVTGPFWNRLRGEGFAGFFEALRIPCMNCHAPASVLDLPEGAHPVERSDAPALGVDCVSCHVSERGIVGAGRSTGPHEVIADERFRDLALASLAICARCHDERAEHAQTVRRWSETPFARDGVTCLHCHMPEVEAPSVPGGPVRRRRSHRFPGDKDVAMLQRALNATIVISEDRRAVVRITNDRMPHPFPASGLNWLIVRVQVRDERGRALDEVERGFGTREWIPGYLDFWPFLHVSKIPYGETREIRVSLPAGHGSVAAEFRYRDWFALESTETVFAHLEQPY